MMCQEMEKKLSKNQEANINLKEATKSQGASGEALEHAISSKMDNAEE
jgi:hypothetical protein